MTWHGIGSVRQITPDLVEQGHSNIANQANKRKKFLPGPEQRQSSPLFIRVNRFSHPAHLRLRLGLHLTYRTLLPPAPEYDKRNPPMQNADVVRVVAHERIPQ
jgi:hypothetical protein